MNTNSILSQMKISKTSYVIQKTISWNYLLLICVYALFCLPFSIKELEKKGGQEKRIKNMKKRDRLIIISIIIICGLIDIVFIAFCFTDDKLKQYDQELKKYYKPDKVEHTNLIGYSKTPTNNINTDGILDQKIKNSEKFYYIMFGLLILSSIPLIIHAIKPNYALLQISALIAVILLVICLLDWAKYISVTELMKQT